MVLLKMRVKESNLSDLIPEWPKWAVDFESDIMEVDLHSKLGKRMSICSDIPEVAHNFICPLFNKYEREKERNKNIFSRRKTANIS